MAAPSLVDLLTVPSQDDVLAQEVLPELKKRKVKLTDWGAGAVQLAQAYVMALMRVSVRLAVATLTAAGFEDYVFGVATPPPNPDGTLIDVTGWAPVVAKQRYGTDQILATYTRRTILLTNASVSPYGPLLPGPSLMIQFPSKNQYILDEAITIPASGSIPAVFRSQFPTDTQGGYNYNDPSGSVLQLVTSSYAGVTATNPAPVYSPVALSGSGQGSVVPSNTPSGSHSVALRVDSTGSINGVGAAVAWSTNVDNLGWVAQSNSVATNLGGFNINVTLVDFGVTLAFSAGAVYYFSTPGSDIVQVGADIESAQVLGTRVRGLWPSLAFTKDVNGNWVPGSPTASAYKTLALSANAQVREVLTSVDPTINNKINLIIAGQGGTPLSPAVIANVQNFFNYFQMLTDLVAVATTTARAITLAGLVVTIKSSYAATAPAAMTRRLQLYLGSGDAAAPLGINGIVDYDYIISLVRTTPGVTRVTGTLLINGVAADYQMPGTPSAYEAATWAQSAQTAFAFATV